MLELYHVPASPFSQAVQIALNEKGLDYISHPIQPSRLEALPPALGRLTEVACNLDGELPVLLHDGRVLSDAAFIALYLDEAFPALPLVAAGATGLWATLVWARYLGDVLAPAVSTLGCQRWLAPALQQQDRSAVNDFVQAQATPERRLAWQQAADQAYSPEELQDAQRKAGMAIARIEQALAAQDHLVTPQCTLADVLVYAVAQPLPTLVPALLNPAVAPRTWAWLDRMAARPAVQAAAANPAGFVPGPEHPRWG